jgi:hypothetical protein
MSSVTLAVVIAALVNGLLDVTREMNEQRLRPAHEGMVI